MPLTERQIWTATKIDTKVQKLAGAGKDDVAILVAMTDQMSAFKELLDTTQPNDMDELSRRFSFFYRYAKILETIASGIQSGEIIVPP